MSLVRAELRRLVKRRITRYALAMLVLVLGGVVLVVSLASHRIGPPERAAAAAEAQRQYQEQLGFAQQEITACQGLTEAQRTERYGPGFECEQLTPPPDAFQAEWNLPYEFNFHNEFSIYIAVFAGIVTLYGFLVGASYVGAEWSSGGMMNLLLWRPRRLLVLGTKLGVLLGWMLGLSVVLGALWTAAFWLIGRYDGVTGTLTAGDWRSIALSGVRGVVLVLVMAALAFGLASFGRHTAMALGAAVGVVVVGEIGARIVLNLARVQFPDRFSLSTYAYAWFQKKLTLEDYQTCEFSGGECNPATWTVTWQHAGVLFAVASALILGAAFWTMRSRDIT